MENIEDKGGEVVQANADGAYDANDNFEFLEAHNIILAIKIRKNVESGSIFYNHKITQIFTEPGGDRRYRVPKVKNQNRNCLLRSPQRTQRVEKILNHLSYLSALAV